MRQWSYREFERVLIKNKFHKDRAKGSHIIFVNDSGNHISVSKNLVSVIANRLIKENNLTV